MKKFNIIMGIKLRVCHLRVEPGMGNGTAILWDLKSRDTKPGILSLLGRKSLGLLGLEKNLKSQGRKFLGLAIPSHAHPWVEIEKWKI